MLYVISTSTLSSIKNISVSSEPRSVVFIRNGTVMIVSMVSPDMIGFYRVSAGNTYTLTSTMTAPSSPYNVYRINDTLLYVAIFAISTPIYTLQDVNGNGGWTWSTLPVTTSFIISGNFQSTFDVCGRMWVSVKGYGIRIFDATGSQSLINWPLSSGLNGIALTNTFELYMADFNNGAILSYRPNIVGCTS